MRRSRSLRGLRMCPAAGDSAPIGSFQQFVYWAAKQHDGRPHSTGTWIKVSAQRVGIVGASLEAAWPYNPFETPCDEHQGPPPAQAVSDAATRTARGVELADRDTTGLRSGIDAGNPIALSVPVYKNWDNNPAVETYGFIPPPLPNSEFTGGHAMCVVGYGFDAETAGGGYFVMRNSWGNQWAAQSPIRAGHGMLPSGTSRTSRGRRTHSS